MKLISVTFFSIPKTTYKDYCGLEIIYAATSFEFTVLMCRDYAFLIVSFQFSL